MLGGAVFLGVLCVLMYVLLYNIIYGYWKRKGIAFPKPKFIFGNFWDIITLKKPLGNFILEMYRSYSNHPFVGLYVMFKPALLIIDACHVKDVLIKDFDHFQENWFTVDAKVDPVLSRNPFVQKYNDWRKSRSLLSPQFTSAKIKSYLPPIDKGCNNLVDYIEKTKQSTAMECVEVANLCARFTGDNVMRCGYGLEANSFLDQHPMTFKALGSVANPIGLAITLKRTYGLLSALAQRILKITFVGNPTPSLFYNVITETISNRQKTNIVRNDYLNHLMKLGNKNLFDTDDIVGHAFTMFQDGLQTSYATMAYTLLELATNPTVQEQARKEVYTVFEKYPLELSYEALKELQYLENVVCETLRKHPIIKFMARVCTKKYELKSPTGESSLTIEKGTPIFISVRGIHQDPRYYPEPDKFDPDRFNEEAKQLRPKATFLGFGEGPRICMGRRFGLAQVISGVAAILLHYELKLNKRTRFPIQEDYFHISDIPISGLYIDFVRRPSNVLQNAWKRMQSV